jgi:hypothetical protein
VADLAPTTPTASARPIFVVGSPRSGTTLLRLILDSHPHIACGPETHFLIDMEHSGRRHWHRLERYGFDREYWYEQCRAMFSQTMSDYARGKGKPRWADKTPPYAMHLPFVMELFPDAQVVHVIRDARMVVSSALARWGWRQAWAAAPLWVQSVSQARAHGAGLGADQYRELRFEQLLVDTESTLEGLFAWLREPWDPRVLDYDTFDHDDLGRNRQISEQARSDSGRAIDPRRARAPRRRLDPVLRARVDRIAGPLNRELGYR